MLSKESKSQKATCFIKQFYKIWKQTLNTLFEHICIYCEINCNLFLCMTNIKLNRFFDWKAGEEHKMTLIELVECVYVTVFFIYQ